MIITDMLRVMNAAVLSITAVHQQFWYDDMTVWHADNLHASQEFTHEFLLLVPRTRNT